MTFCRDDEDKVDNLQPIRPINRFRPVLYKSAGAVNTFSHHFPAHTPS